MAAESGWLTNLTNWIARQVKRLWDAIEDFFGDFLVEAVEALLDLISIAVNAIPIPDFLTGYTVCSLIAQGGETLAWAFGTFRIGEGLTLIGAGYAFRLLRKFLTLFQW